jgi:hypothetical protein
VILLKRHVKGTFGACGQCLFEGTTCTVRKRQALELTHDLPAGILMPHSSNSSTELIVKSKRAPALKSAKTLSAQGRVSFIRI